MSKPDLKKEAIRLRVEERLSLPEIQVTVPASKGALSLWLRPYPLTPEELVSRRSRNAPSPECIRKSRGTESGLNRLVKSLGVEQTSMWKGRVAEAAVLLRIALLGHTPLRAVFEGHHVDLFVCLLGGRTVTLQIRWAYQARGGLPLVDLRSKGKVRKKYEDGEIDFVVGYSLFNDTAYVFAWDEVRKMTAVTVRSDAEERWDKLQSVAQR